MDFESMWYEYTPYLYAIAGIISILHIGSIIGVGLGLILVAAAGMIIYMRQSYRKTRSNESKQQITSPQ